MTDAQRQFLSDNPQFGPVGPPRSVKFSEWGTLYADGTYQRLDNAPRKAIQVGAGAIGVAVEEQSE